MKKILVSLFLGVFLISIASAFEFDNKLTYSEKDMKVELKNWFGLGEDYGSLELKSHTSIDEVKHIAVGKSVVMWYEFNFEKEYINGLGDVRFIDLNTKYEVFRNHKFVYFGSELIDETINIPEYQPLENGTMLEVSRYKEPTGNQIEKSGWLNYNSKDIPIGNIIIGLEVEVLDGDLVDSIWTIGGKEISKHAVWTADIGFNLQYNYEMNVINSSLNDTYENVTAGWRYPIANSSVPSPTNRLVAGARNSSLNFSSSAGCGGSRIDYGHIYNQMDLNGSFSFSFWIKPHTTTDNNNYPFLASTQVGGGSDKFGMALNTAGTPVVELRASNNTLQSYSSNYSIPDLSWSMLTVVQNATYSKLFINTTFVGYVRTYTHDWYDVWFNMPRFNCQQGYSVDMLRYYNSSINESVISTLWNSGAGIEYQEGMSVVTSCASNGYIPSNCTCYVPSSNTLYIPSTVDSSSWNCT